MQLQCSSWVPALAAALRVTGQSHTGIWQAHELLLSTGALGNLSSSRCLVEVILRISNSGFLNLLLQISKHQKCL